MEVVVVKQVQKVDTYRYDEDVCVILRLCIWDEHEMKQQVHDDEDHLIQQKNNYKARNHSSMPVVVRRYEKTSCYNNKGTLMRE